MSGSRLLEFSSGAAIGLLVGFMAGLSISPVTSTILGALATGLLVLLGFRTSKGPNDPDPHAWRVLGFGVFCSVALAIGIGARTHQWLSPSLKVQKQGLDAVFSPADTNQILLSTNYGLRPAGTDTTNNNKQTVTPGGKDTETEHSKSEKPNSNPQSQPVASADLVSGTLLRAGRADYCQVGSWDRLQNVSAFVFELKKWDARLAHVIESAPENSRESMSKSLSQYLCH